MIGARSVLRIVSAKAVMRGGSRSDSTNSPQLIAGERASVSFGFNSRPSLRAKLSRMESPTAMPTENIHLLEAVEIDHITVGRMVESARANEALRRDGRGTTRGRQAVKLCAPRLHQPFLQVLNSVTSVTVPTRRTTSPSRRPRPRLQGEPHVVASSVRRRSEKQRPTALSEHAVERGAEPVAVERMAQLEDQSGRRAAQRARVLQAESNDPSRAR